MQKWRYTNKKREVQLRDKDTAHPSDPGESGPRGKRDQVELLTYEEYVKHQDSTWRAHIPPHPLSVGQVIDHSTCRERCLPPYRAIQLRHYKDLH